MSSGEREKNFDDGEAKKQNEEKKIKQINQKRLGTQMIEMKMLKKSNSSNLEKDRKKNFANQTIAIN